MIQKERDIDGLKVLCTMLDFETSNPLLWELMRKAAPLLAMLQSDGFGQKELQDAFAPLAVQLFASFPAEDWERIRDTLYRNVVVTGEMADGGGKAERVELRTRAGMNRALSGRQMTAMRIVLFALEVNFRDFYDALATGLRKTMEMVSASPSPSTS